MHVGSFECYRLYRRVVEKQLSRCFSVMVFERSHPKRARSLCCCLLLVHCCASASLCAPAVRAAPVPCSRHLRSLALLSAPSAQPPRFSPCTLSAAPCAPPLRSNVAQPLQPLQLHARRLWPLRAEVLSSLDTPQQQPQQADDASPRRQPREPRIQTRRMHRPLPLLQLLHLPPLLILPLLLPLRPSFLPSVVRASHCL